MNKVYIFDVDGTLTPSRRPMTEYFENFFFKWANKNTFYLVSGSDLDKIKEQIGYLYLDRAKGIFTCGGNKFYINNKLEYEKAFKPPENLLTYLGFQIKISDTPVQASNHREDRGSMLNFSIVGRDCTLEERQKYFEWDNQVGERERIAKSIRDGWPDLDATIGGQISIDIAPKGNDKSQVIKRVKNNNPNCQYIFIGDRTMEGGNDYPLAKVMDEMEDGEVYQVDGHERTMEILKGMEE